MKKYLNIILAITVAIAFAVINFGCDEFNNFPVNIPISKQIVATGNNTIAFGEGDFCLDKDSQSYKDFRDKFSKLTFIQAAYRTRTVTANGISAPNLKGDLVITVKTELKSLLFTITLSNVNPSDYINKAIPLSLNQNQIQAINAYVGNLNNTCFNESIEVQNISGGNPPYVITGVIDMVFEGDAKL